MYLCRQLREGDLVIGINRRNFKTLKNNKLETFWVYAQGVS